MSVVFVILSLVAIVLCVLAGASKLTGQKQMVESAQHFGIPWERYRMIGALEVLAAIGLLLGLFWSPLGVLAALGMVLLIVGALIFHSRAHDSVGMMAPAAVTGVVNLLVLITGLAK